jgi:alkylhydroperoxidase family enzyme
LPDAEAAVASYSKKLTKDPGEVTEGDVETLRRAGLGDLEILDANNMCAHLNYVNRIANGLGLKTEVGEEFHAYAAIPE